MTSITSHSLHLLQEILPVFLLAIVASSLIDKFLPDDFIPKFTAKHNEFFAILNASIIGALIPLCTCGMIPLASKLHQKGLGWKPLTAFLVAGNACSIPTVILTASVNYKLAIVRLIASIIFGVFTAQILACFTSKNFKFEMIGIKHEDHTEQDCCHHNHKRSIIQEIFSDLRQMLQDFLPWILVAVLIAALIHHYFSTSEIIRLLVLEPSTYFISPILASLIGFPFYFCAGSDVPLSSEFILMGLPFGTIISFMLASPGVNLTSLLVYQKAIGFKQASLLLLASIVCSSIIGIILNL